VGSRGSAILTVLAVALAGCASVGGGEPGAAPPAPEPSTPATGREPASTAAADTPTATEAAAAFLRDELGMLAPVAGNSTETGQDTVDVPVRPGSLGEGAEQAQAPVTVVALERAGDGWAVTSVRTDQIQVDTPQPDQQVTSPVALAGKASAFEGTVQVQVRQNIDGKDPVLGEAVVQGSGTMDLGPFKGQVGFTGATPGPGWLVFFVSSEADGQFVQATVVPVTLAG